jgi:hypothetical protein
MKLLLIAPTIKEERSLNGANIFSMWQNTTFR